MGRFNQSMRALVSWRGGLFLTEGKIGVLSVSSLFLRRVGVHVGVGVCIRTHTHNAHMGYSDVSPGLSEALCISYSCLPRRSSQSNDSFGILTYSPFGCHGDDMS